MKKITLIILSLLFLFLYGFAQEESEELVKNFRLDFAVPDHPAFKLMNETPSDILRPSSVNDLSVITSNFMSGNSIVLPQSFAMEVAPILLAKANNITLSEYEKNKVWHSLRVSLGTEKQSYETFEQYNLSIGAKITVIDKGDIKADKDYISELSNLLADVTKDQNDLKLEYLESEGKTTTDMAFDSELTKEVEAYIAEQLEVQKKDYPLKIKELKQKYKEQNWNKHKLDFAAAVLNNSPDSLAKNIQFGTLGLWTTIALPLKKWGQVLIGASYYYSNFDSIAGENMEIEKYNLNRISLTSRLYFGTNRIKGFLEGQYYMQNLTETTNNALLNLGAELNLVNGIWVNFNAGYNFNDIFMEGSTSTMFTSFDIRFQLPENFKLF
jgi:hypothetical protein